MKGRIIFILICFIYMTFSLKSFLQTNEKDQLEEKKSKIEKEIKITNALIEETRVQKANTLNELKLLKSNIDKRNQLINELNGEISKINSDIDKNTQIIESLKSDLQKVRNEYAGLIYYAFKNNNSKLNYMYLLASESVNQFYSRYKYLQQYNEYRRKQINLILALNKSIETKIVELNGKKENKLSVINKKLTERATLLNESERTDNIVKDLKQKEKELHAELEKKIEIEKKLEKEIEEIIRKEAQKKKIVALNKNEKLLSNDFLKNKGKLPWPTENGIITGKFGEHPHPVLKEIKIRNNGIDISTNSKSLVRVVFNGVVSKVFTIKGANSTVIVQHGNFFTVYHNLINVRVKAGDKVLTKDIIGEVYTDQKTSESVLHFELWEELEKQDPELWLSN
jgi:murein hydrolase activator